MKVSIITVLNTVNYGSALQTFATQRFFEKMGVKWEGFVQDGKNIFASEAIFSLFLHRKYFREGEF